MLKSIRIGRYLAICFTCLFAICAVASCHRVPAPADPGATLTAATTHRLPAPATTHAPPTATPFPARAPAKRSPLTGLPTLLPAADGRRPVAIMFSNIQAALPQLGIGSADLVYEMVIENGYTRLMAFYADAASIPEVCSIRSTRDSFVDFAMGHDAILVHYGASVLCWDYMATLEIETLDLQFYPAGSWRDPQIAAARGAEHSVKTHAGLIEDAIAGKGMRAELAPSAIPAFSFHHPDAFVPAGDTIAAAPDRMDCHTLALPFSTWSTSPVAGFTYDAALRTYTKSQYGAPQIDGLTGEPLRFTNVLLLFTTIYPQDAYGHVAAQWQEGGDGLYLSGGKMQEIKWEKTALYAPFTYYSLAGHPLQINAGTSYVGIVSNTMRAAVEIS